MFNNLFTKRTVHLYILIWILIVLIIISVSTMVRYFVKGEDKVPFIISKILTVSSAQTRNLNLEEKTYTADIMEINNVYISFEKNEKHKKDDTIKEIIIDNFKILEGGTLGNFEIYKETKQSDKFIYTEDNKQNTISYTGVQILNEENQNLEIANQGGIIKFSIIFNNLGNIEYSENDNVNVDGTLINRLGLSYDNIKAKISFDIKIKLSSGNSFYTNIEMDLPVGNILQKGIASEEYRDIKNLVFKRCK